MPYGIDGDGFNTQPPEGGWLISSTVHRGVFGFQHTAARRRLGTTKRLVAEDISVSTHSRPKAAGRKKKLAIEKNRGFNTQPPEGGWFPSKCSGSDGCCFNTQPPEGGWVEKCLPGEWVSLFQHTAARRRLVRPKKFLIWLRGFNTQPPEGGWILTSL